MIKMKKKEIIYIIGILTLCLMAVVIAVSIGISNNDVIFITETRYKGNVVFSCNKEKMVFSLDEPNMDIDDEISYLTGLFCPDGKISSINADDVAGYENRKPAYRAINTGGRN